MREVTEETGIPDAALRLVDVVPIDVDVHPIFVNTAKANPPTTSTSICITPSPPPSGDVALQGEEARDFAWLPDREIEPACLAERITAICELGRLNPARARPA